MTIQCRKTLEAIKLCSETSQSVVVCVSLQEADRVADLARSHNIKIPHPVTLYEILNHKLKGSNYTNLILDNIDMMLPIIFGKTITGITLLENKEEGSKSHINEKIQRRTNMLESTIDGFKDTVSDEKQQTIVIRDIKEAPIALHYKDEFVGYIHTEVSLYDVMCQIKDKDIEGYSIKFESKVYTITRKGSLNFGSEGKIFFPLMNIYLDKLMK